MIQVTILYGHPQDPTAFDRHYRGGHASLAKRLPGLRGYTTNKPISINPQESSPYYLIANLYFEDRSAMQAAFQSSEGQAAIDDVPHFATGGVTMLAGEIQVYDPVVIG